MQLIRKGGKWGVRGEGEGGREEGEKEEVRKRENVGELINKNGQTDISSDFIFFEFTSFQFPHPSHSHSQLVSVSPDVAWINSPRIQKRIK